MQSCIQQSNIIMNALKKTSHLVLPSFPGSAEHSEIFTVAFPMGAVAEGGNTSQVETLSLI